MVLEYIDGPPSPRAAHIPRVGDPSIYPTPGAKGLKDLHLKAKARFSQGQNLALTGLHVPYSLDSGELKAIMRERVRCRCPYLTASPCCDTGHGLEPRGRGREGGGKRESEREKEGRETLKQSNY